MHLHDYFHDLHEFGYEYYYAYTRDEAVETFIQPSLPPKRNKYLHMPIFGT